MNDGARNGVQTGPSVRLWSADAEQPKFAHASKQFAVEPLVSIVFERLRFNVFLRPFTHHFAKHEVFFAGVGDVLGGHTSPSHRWLLTFGAPSGSSRERSLLATVFITEHFTAKGLVVSLVVKLERNDHPLIAVLTLVLLTDHETHVGIDSNSIAVDADTKRHAAAPSLHIAEGRTQFAEINTIVLVGVEGHDDVGNLSR